MLLVGAYCRFRVTPLACSASFDNRSDDMPSFRYMIEQGVAASPYCLQSVPIGNCYRLAKEI